MFELPKSLAGFPRHQLSYSHPSPIHYLPGLTKYVNNSVSERQPSVCLWIKREDQAGPLACYGNKYRKFEYIIPDIVKRRDVTTIVTEGAVQSNHTVQVASMARTLDLKCSVLLHRGIGGARVADDIQAYIRVGNVQINHLLGADVRMTDENDTGDENGPLTPFLQELKEQGEVPYWISSGASLHPLGGLGYARCAFEIEAQVEDLIRSRQLEHRFSQIFVACGSGSTLAGLIVGYKLLEKTNAHVPKIIGVLTSPTKPLHYHQKRILHLARVTAKLVGLDPDIDIKQEDVHLDNGFVGTGYGVLDEQTAAALDITARKDSVLLDPVYTAKVMNAMLHWARRQSSRFEAMSDAERKPIDALFIHTGGQSALSAYADVAASFQQSQV